MSTIDGANDIRRWLKARQLGEDLERSLTRTVPDQRDAIDLAFELMSLREYFHGWPPPADPVSIREERVAREAWSRLRRAWRVRYSLGMANRWADWFRQAEADLAHARALEAGHHEWACFAARQAAEKALKAAHGARGQEAWGHSVTELLDALRPNESAIDDAMLDRGRALDKLYIATRYPNGLPSGAPADYYTRAEADRAIGDAEVIIDWCRGVLPR